MNPAGETDFLDYADKVLEKFGHSLKDECCVLDTTDLKSLDDLHEEGLEENFPVQLIDLSCSIKHDGRLEFTLLSSHNNVEFIEVEDLGTVVDGLAIDEEAVVGVAHVVLGFERGWARGLHNSVGICLGFCNY